MRLPPSPVLFEESEGFVLPSSDSAEPNYWIQLSFLPFEVPRWSLQLWTHLPAIIYVSCIPAVDALNTKVGPVVFWCFRFQHFTADAVHRSPLSSPTMKSTPLKHRNAMPTSFAKWCSNSSTTSLPFSMLPSSFGTCSNCAIDWPCSLLCAK